MILILVLFGSILTVVRLAQKSQSLLAPLAFFLDYRANLGKVLIKFIRMGFQSDSSDYRSVYE